MPAIETKRCGKCGQELPLTAFNRAGDGRQHWCRECFRAYFKARGDLHRRQVAVTQRRRSERSRAVVVAHLAQHPCVDCGERDVAVLEFDHVRQRAESLAELIARGRPAAEIHGEIERCEVRCANCHRRVTAHRAGWIRATGRFDDPRLTMRPVRARNLAHIYASLAAAGCVDCGTRELLVLEFDHVGAKTRNVTELAWSEVSLARLDAEIGQCEVRCCNCHRRRTASRRRRRAQAPMIVEASTPAD